MTSVPATTSANPGNPGHPAPRRARVGSAALWFGIFGGPAAWSVQTLVNLPVASHGCFPRLEPLNSPIVGVRPVAFVVSVLAVAVVVAATVVATRSWMHTRQESHEASGSGRAHQAGTSLMETGEGRTRFMALSGVLISSAFLIASVIHLAAVFIISPCAGQ